MPKKPALYIDVDGVLFGIYGGTSQLRPNVVQFLRWCTEHFECYWLTAWPKYRLDGLLSCLMASDVAEQIKDAPGRSRHFGKAPCIDYRRTFYWIEDAISDEEKAYLSERGKLSQYIFVNAWGRDCLEETWRDLGKRIGVEVRPDA